VSGFSKTLLPCDCGWLSQPINDPSLSLSYDALSNTIGIGHESRYVLYHCPFCGGQFPDHSKPMWVPIVPGSEFDRMHELTVGFTTLNQVFEKLGTPDYASWIYPDMQFRCIEYYELSELLWVEFIAAAAGELVSCTVHIKSLSARHKGDGDA
jgi:hypothetical protein